MRRLLVVLVAIVAALALTGGSAAAANGVSREEAVRQLDSTRRSVDETLALIKAGEHHRPESDRESSSRHASDSRRRVLGGPNHAVIHTEFQP